MTSSADHHGGHFTLGRRRFLGFVLAAPTLVAAARLGIGEAEAAVPSNPQASEAYDLNDALTDAARPTANLITVQVNPDGSASFALPRAEVGQGITTAAAMLIAEEMDLPVDKVHVSLADARPELMFNQLTGGSNTMNAMYTPIRVAASIAKGRLLQAAAAELDDVSGTLTAREGLITSTTGAVLSYGDLAEKAAAQQDSTVETQLKPESEFRIVGKPQRRVDALAAVTGKKQFTTDLAVPDAKPTMLCRPPTINGSPGAVRNTAEVLEMPGVTDVVPISSGVAVRAETFGQCIDAVNALRVDWEPGPVEGQSDDSVLAELKAATPPMAVPEVPGAKSVDAEFAFAFVNGSALDTNAAVADVRPDRAEIWSSMKVPIVAKQEIARSLGLPQEAVRVHVTEGGGSFGRKLFHDAAAEAAEASQKMGKPVKLMWHRVDDCRQGRVHPMSFSRIRANFNDDGVLSFEQHHASVRTDFSHGLGEAVSQSVSRAPAGGVGLSESIFELTQNSPYNFGATKQLLTETHQSPEENQPRGTFNTSSVRNVYSPNVRCAQELVVDQLAEQFGEDPYEFRREHVKNDKLRTVLDKAAEVGEWGKSLPEGVAQGIAVHTEYKHATACLVEIDCRPETVNRPIRDGVTGPRVTRGVFVTIPGQVVVNPLGMEAMIQGGFLDGMAQALTASVHLVDGHVLEGSWDNFFYARQWNVPFDFQAVILPPDPQDQVAGAGEVGVAASFAAVACAYARATGEVPTTFPINHNGPLAFEPKPFVPPLPPSPTDGLRYTY
ncbi:molybdopterin cofactor-binding domain-containing protein [Saccharopolyspora griseoalba]|uniref:Molybdopterin cofactor-binding domain-containing protein n=1 Tax=Saccharopolyspora griseoalba TaxID=1431848 RepID=A0ABW2LQE5_9PSEU